MLLAASLERAVTHSAELLLAVGAVLAIVWGILRNRIGILRWPVLGVALLALGVGTALGGWAWHEKRPRTVRGSSTQEFVNRIRPPVKKKKKRHTGPRYKEQWPTYGFDRQRGKELPPEPRARRCGDSVPGCES